MRVLKNDKILFCDVDDTLVMSNYSRDTEGIIEVEHPITKAVVILLPHKEHIKLLIKFSKQGFAIVVWSKLGWQWAEAVVNALGLKRVVTLVMSKSSFYLDDSTNIDNILGEQLYRPIEEKRERK